MNFHNLLQYIFFFYSFLGSEQINYLSLVFFVLSHFSHCPDFHTSRNLFEPISCYRNRPALFTALTRVCSLAHWSILPLASGSFRELSGERCLCKRSCGQELCPRRQNKGSPGCASKRSWAESRGENRGSRGWEAEQDNRHGGKGGQTLRSYLVGHLKEGLYNSAEKNSVCLMLSVCLNQISNCLIPF